MADKKKIKKGKVVILSGEGFTVLGSEKFKKQKRQEKLDYEDTIHIINNQETNNFDSIIFFPKDEKQHIEVGRKDFRNKSGTQFVDIGGLNEITTSAVFGIQGYRPSDVISITSYNPLSSSNAIIFSSSKESHLEAKLDFFTLNDNSASFWPNEIGKGRRLITFHTEFDNHTYEFRNYDGNSEVISKRASNFFDFTGTTSSFESIIVNRKLLILRIKKNKLPIRWFGFVFLNSNTP